MYQNFRYYKVRRGILNRTKKLELSVTIADILSLSISYILAAIIYLIIFQDERVFFDQSFGQTLLIFLLSLFFAEIITLSKNRLFLKRNNVQEIYNIIKNIAFMGMFFAVFVFIMNYSKSVSRGVFLLTLVIYVFVGFIGRLIIRRFYLKGHLANKQKLIIVTTYEKAQSQEKLDIIQHGSNYEFVGFAIIDRDCIGESINGYKVVSNFESVVEFTRKEIVDSLLFVVDNGWWAKIEPIVSEIWSMGVVVNFGVDLLEFYDGVQTQVNYIGDYPVLSYAQAFPSEETLFLKRIMDIIGGLIGSAITLLVAIILGPIIKLESPGPIFFKQKRVGLNGRYFYIYKFRSMGVNAEQQKKDLLKENEVEGHMFKMTDDPRVTKVGKFIRATSIDELPQFFNVVKGEMSLVGTRPPTIDEFKQYSSHHKRRLSMKPGITGMWQVSGRSNITDFEEVVRLDTEYIDNFTLVLDFKILFKTLIVVFAKIGSK
nr:sugar transferase [Erysipelothrix larvae]